MNRVFFCESFNFRMITLVNNRHNDNSSGIECHFIARMRKGSGVIRTLTGEELHLTEGDIFYLPNGLRYHSYWSVSDDSFKVVEWESYGFIYFPNDPQKRYTMQKISASDKAISFLDRLRDDMVVSPTSVGYLYLFLGEVLQKMDELNSDPRSKLWKTAIEYIKKHDKFKVSDLAQACRMSESGMYTFFRQYGQTTPIEVKNRLKIESAIDLLRFTDISIEDISTSLGFCSSAYFRKIVKQQTGKTPTQIRKEQSRLDIL